MRRTGLSWMAMAAIIVMGGCSKSEDARTASEQPAAIGTGGAASNVKGDAEFVRDVAMMNQADIQLSQLALEKATSPDIKTFARMLIDQHEAAGNQLKSALSGQSIDWPAQLDEKHRDIADELAQKQGPEFEREYVEAMVEAHQDLAARLESRLDVRSLSDWKTAAAGRTETKALPDPKAALSDVQVRPARSDNDTTMKVNQWAAETYPLAQKHLDTARALELAAKKRSTN